MNDFNAGKRDVLLINRAGSTGLSLHSHPSFADKRQRHMIIGQPAKNIDTFMQMLGRVHRTGQVVPPSYTLLLSNRPPAENRPAAVLVKKLASLNANVTAVRGRRQLRRARHHERGRRSGGRGVPRRERGTGGDAGR